MADHRNRQLHASDIGGKGGLMITALLPECSMSREDPILFDSLSKFTKFDAKFFLSARHLS